MLIAVQDSNRQVPLFFDNKHEVISAVHLEFWLFDRDPITLGPRPSTILPDLGLLRVLWIVSPLGLCHCTSTETYLTSPWLEMSIPSSIRAVMLDVAREFATTLELHTFTYTNVLEGRTFWCVCVHACMYVFVSTAISNLSWWWAQKPPFKKWRENNCQPGVS